MVRVFSVLKSILKNLLFNVFIMFNMFIMEVKMGSPKLASGLHAVCNCTEGKKKLRIKSRCVEFVTEVADDETCKFCEHYVIWKNDTNLFDFKVHSRDDVPDELDYAVGHIRIYESR